MTPAGQCWRGSRTRSAGRSTRSPASSATSPPLGSRLLIGGLVAWVIDAVVWVVGGVFDFFLDATDPNVQADWFVTGDGPYATTAAIGATLLVGFVLAGIIQGALAGDVGGMLRRMAWTCRCRCSAWSAWSRSPRR